MGIGFWSCSAKCHKKEERKIGENFVKMDVQGESASLGLCRRLEMALGHLLAVRRAQYNIAGVRQDRYNCLRVSDTRSADCILDSTFYRLR